MRPSPENVARPLKAFTAGFGTETNSFSSIITDLAAFERTFLYRPGEHPEALTEVSAPLFVLRERQRRQNWRIVEGTYAFALPAGTVTKEAYESLRDEILQQLADGAPYDLVALSLHGATFTAPDTPIALLHDTVGRAVSPYQIRIVDEAGNALPVGKAGEIAVKTPYGMNGYWNGPDQRPELSAPEPNISRPSKRQRAILTSRACPILNPHLRSIAMGTGRLAPGDGSEISTGNQWRDLPVEAPSPAALCRTCTGQGNRLSRYIGNSP